jgi:translation initiation factor IF-2
MTDSNQIRINELARELEVKAKAIIDYLPEAGVTEKKTHSSSIEVEAAVKVREHFRALAEAEVAAEQKAVADKAAKDAAARAARMKPAAVAPPPAPPAIAHPPAPVIAEPSRPAAPPASAVEARPAAPAPAPAIPKPAIVQPAEAAKSSPAPSPAVAKAPARPPVPAAPAQAPPVSGPQPRPWPRAMQLLLRLPQRNLRLPRGRLLALSLLLRRPNQIGIRCLPVRE